MHLKNITKGILPFILIVGLFKLRGIDAVGNQKVSGESKQIETYDDYNEDADVSNDEVLVPKSTIKPHFESNSITYYATKEIENITLECLPTNFNDSKHQILWYNDEHPITNGNTSLSIDKYAVDNKYRLTILNYSKKTNGNFSCAVLPTDIRQYVVIEFGAPPENITHQIDGSTVIIVEIGLILTSLMAIVLSNY